MAPVAVSVGGRLRGDSNARAVLQPNAPSAAAESIGREPIKNLCCVGAGYVGMCAT
jgi:hypothetical protein